MSLWPSVEHALGSSELFSFRMNLPIVAQASLNF